MFDTVFYRTTIGAVEEAGEKTAATEHSKLSEQDKVQWLTDRLAHSVTDLSQTRPDEPSSGTADKGRWVETQRADLSHLSSKCVFCCEIHIRPVHWQNSV